MNTVNENFCVRCGRDVAGEKRVKDTAGHYYCTPCYESASKAAQPIARVEPTPPVTIADTPSIPATDSTTPSVTGSTRYTISGANRKTGEDVTLSIDAESEKEAIAKASNIIFVSACRATTGTGLKKPSNALRPAGSAMLKVGVAAIVGLAIISVLGYVLFIRGHWEKQNREHLLTMISEGKAFVAQDDFRAANVKYAEVFQLIADHTIRTADLQAAVANARIDYQRAKAEVAKVEKAENDKQQAEQARLNAKKEALETERKSAERDHKAHEQLLDDIANDRLVQAVIARYPELEFLFQNLRDQTFGALNKKSLTLKVGQLVATGSISLDVAEHLNSFIDSHCPF